MIDFHSKNTRIVRHTSLLQNKHKTNKQQAKRSDHKNLGGPIHTYPRNSGSKTNNAACKIPTLGSITTVLIITDSKKLTLTLSSLLLKYYIMQPSL